MRGSHLIVLLLRRRFYWHGRFRRLGGLGSDCPAQSCEGVGKIEVGLGWSFLSAWSGPETLRFIETLTDSLGIPPGTHAEVNLGKLELRRCHPLFKACWETLEVCDCIKRPALTCGTGWFRCPGFFY